MEKLPSLVEVNEITDILSFLQSVDWKNDSFLLALITFHVVILIATIGTRNMNNVQFGLFFILLLMVYFSDKINEFAAQNWKFFSNQQYFDSKGLFISIVFSIPILINCMLLIGSWLYQSTQLLSTLKLAQLKKRIKHQASTKEAVVESASSESSKKYD